MPEKRVAVFQYEWVLQQHTLHFLTKLVENGYKVDVFLYRCDSNLINISDLSGSANVILYDRYAKWLQFQDWILGAFRFKLGISLYWLKPILDGVVVDQARKRIEHEKYDIALGIEKKGLIWASMVFESINTPILYYSLELYTDDHPWAHTIFDNFSRVRELETLYHQKARATIIQDKLRKDALFASNSISQAHPTYLIPIGVSGVSNTKKVSFLHERLGVDRNKRIVIYFGAIRKGRFVFEFARRSFQLPENYILVFHGDISKDDFSAIRNIAGYGSKFYVSNQLVDVQCIGDIVASAFIGICYYDNEITNDRLTAFSSEKIALYLKYGVPVICAKNESYEILWSRYKCLEMLANIDGFGDAVRTISSNYDEYAREAALAFDKLYSYDSESTEREIKRFLVDV